MRRRTGGVGKLFFLSIASTFFSKRRKSASALERMGISSMVFERSLTNVRFALVSNFTFFMEILKIASEQQMIKRNGGMGWQTYYISEPRRNV